ncbi:MAG: 2Fe-2S iron-sulfur cluster-binding protein [Acidimicrobiia bacterium]
MSGTSFILNGEPFETGSTGSLLVVLRDEARLTAAKDGCAPQGQCGCCTVWVDGEPRVSCVTPVTRVNGRVVTTLEGLTDEVRHAWGEALCATGGSQCGFCSPGIIMRLEAMVEDDHESFTKAMLAHTCRCTGWQTIEEAVAVRRGARVVDLDRTTDAARQRAALEGGATQDVGTQVALGGGGFADDTAPRDALVALRSLEGEWHVADDLATARRAAGTVQGRKSTAPLRWPVPGIEGVWARTLTTTWVEPAYVEPDAAWCTPGGEPRGPLSNGGAFGGKSSDELRDTSRRLADLHGRTVRVLSTREDVVRRGPKRPPMSLAVRADGTGVVHAVRTDGLAALLARVAPDWSLVEHDAVGPGTSLSIRGAGWAEIAVMRCAVSDPGEWGDEVVTPDGARASAHVDDDEVTIRVDAGRVKDATVLRSYAIGAAHMALGWVRSEGLAVGDDGVPLDLTIRSFGVLRAVDTPRFVVHIVESTRPPVNGSDAVFAAVAAAAWRHGGFVPRWPMRADR